MYVRVKGGIDPVFSVLSVIVSYTFMITHLTHMHTHKHRGTGLLSCVAWYHCCPIAVSLYKGLKLPIMLNHVNRTGWIKEVIKRLFLAQDRSS